MAIVRSEQIERMPSQLDHPYGFVRRAVGDVLRSSVPA